MSEKKELEDCPSEEASSQAESYEANKSGTSETYDMKDFCPGIRIEAKDFDGKWYPAKVSDVDWTENEILVHFENWNTKFDEWIPMDSSRLRPLQKPLLQQKDHVKFSKGEEVMAMWSPYQKYPATIQAVLANDRYDVLFYDGFLKRLKSHKISKLEGETVKSEVRNFTDIGTKEERRERKRKINVAELFHINKRSRKKGLVHSKSQGIKTYPVSKSKSKNTMIKKAVMPEENRERIGGMESNEIKQRDDKLPNPGSSVPTKALVDTIPAAFEVKYINGQTEMWSKQLYQRSEGRTAGKLDIVILNPQGRKFRSRNEIMKFCEENGIIYSHEAFDFSAKGRPKSKSTVQTSLIKPEVNADNKEKSSVKKSQRRPQLDVPLGTPQTPSVALPSEVLPSDVSDSNKVFIGDFEVVIENGKFICPVKVCGKHFRRENLLHMHMKHYHPEFSKYLDYTPSVTDLAYARTVGGLDAVEGSSPAPRKVIERPEKLSSKVENIRKTSDTSSDYSKEPKKLKLSETRPDSKNHSVKGLSEGTATSTEGVENLMQEENQKNKSNPNVSLVKNISNSNEKDSSPLEKIGNSLENKSTEHITSESRNSVSSHAVIKSLRHRLNGRKKAGRFQGSFADHMRKKRIISQDHSRRPQNRMNRQQQPQHLRQQLQEVLPLQTTIPSQSCVEDTNSNASSQSHTLARYPKPHLNITNEISGKNNLLTSSKTLSPVSKKLNVNEEYCFDKNDANSRKDSELNSKLNESEELLNDESEARKKAKAVKQCLQNKRSFLAGLISARKRRSKESYRLRRKGKRKIRNVQPSGFCWKLYDSGLSQGIKKPDAITDSTESVGGNSIKATEAVGKDFASRDSNVLSRLACDDEKVETEDMKNLKPNFKKSIRLKMKRINVEKLKLTDSDSTVRVCKCNTKGNSDECKTCKKFLFDEPFDSVKSDDKAAEPKERILKTENTDSIRISLEEKSLLERKRNREGKAEQENSVKAGENKGPEKPEPEKEIRIEINANNLPKSFVLLENVCRKDIGIKCVNVSKRGNDENGRNVQKNIETGPIREKNVRRGKREGKGNRKSNSRKRVRFENAVMEKWINVDEGDECDRAKIISNETDSQSREGRREERKKKLTKGQVVEYLTEKEANQIERLDDSSREENSLPHNNSGLDQTEGVEDSKSALVVENNKVEKLRRNEIINCICGITEEDGLMIQCDLCLCWQHGHCAGIFRESDVPDKYTCAICKNPYRARPSMKYLHDQEWLKEGTLPSLSFRSKRDDVINQRRTILKRSHDLSGSIALLARVIHSLRLKVNIAEKKDHPKLWLWAKKWTEKKPNRLKDESDVKEEKVEQSLDSTNEVKKEGELAEDEKQLPKAPEPEAPIDSAECKLNLLDHLIHYQTLLDARLSCIESLVAELESMQDDAVNDETPDRYPRTKATVQMLLRDLNTMKKIAII